MKKKNKINKHLCRIRDVCISNIMNKNLSWFMNSLIKNVGSKRYFFLFIYSERQRLCNYFLRKKKHILRHYYD